MENKIILIEDDEEIRGMITDYLSGEFEVLSFNDGTTAIRTNISYDEYSLALIDLMLPDMSGMEIIKSIRRVTNIPIIIITAKDNDTDKSLGLNLGADDYVVKPFSLIELAARIKANIRRARTYQVLPSNSIVKIKDIEIDPQSHMVTRKGRSIDLTPIEFELLYLLASHPGQAYSKERLYELIWKEPYFGNENVLNTHINRLRLKLKNNAEDTTAYIKTLWGIGYKMEDKWMWLLFAILLFVLLIILIWQQIQHKELEREINYITDRLASLSITSDNGFVLIPTDNDSIKKLGAVLNTLLQDFYCKKSEFEQSKQAMAQVLTNISHDIRTPLTVLKGNSEMLSNITNDPSMPENVHAMADKIDRKADDLISTINDYFTMSKIASGDLPIKLKKENVSRLCQDTILDYYDLLEQKQFEVDIQIPDPPIFAYIDNEALQRILKNLIDNAIRHGGDGKYLSLRLTTSNGNSIIEIEDHGNGMSPQQQKQIFARNYTTARKSSGSGLGLAISKRLAEQIGAELEVYSIQNERTTFSIILKS